MAYVSMAYGCTLHDLEDAEHADGGAAEHMDGAEQTVSDEEQPEVCHAAPWTGCVVFANLDLQACALRGARWPQRRTRLLNVVMHWFDSAFAIDDSDLHGIFVSDLGSIHDILEDRDKSTFDEVIRSAFLAKIYSVPQLVWPVRYNGMMAAFRNNIAVVTLPVLTGMDGLEPWRVVERSEIYGATEHGCYKLLVYNNSQPSSKRSPFPHRMRMQLCKAMVADAINYCTVIHDRHACVRHQCCGVVFGGDSHCRMEHWEAAFGELDWMEVFQVPQIYGLDHSNGHLAAVAVKGFAVTFAFRVERNPGHEGTLYFKWSCECCRSCLVTNCAEELRRVLFRIPTTHDRDHLPAAPLHTELVFTSEDLTYMICDFAENGGD